MIIILIFNLYVSVSGMESTSLVLGRPYGGCSILFHKSLMPCNTPLASCSERFCRLRLTDVLGISTFIVCVYMPSLVPQLLLITWVLLENCRGS